MLSSITDSMMKDYLFLHLLKNKANSVLSPGSRRSAISHSDNLAPSLSVKGIIEVCGTYLYKWACPGSVRVSMYIFLFVWRRGFDCRAANLKLDFSPTYIYTCWVIIKSMVTDYAFRENFPFLLIILQTAIEVLLVCNFYNTWSKVGVQSL